MNLTGSRRVLYAEDNEDACFMVTTMLGLSDIEVSTAGTLAEAWRLGQAERFDLYLLDSRRQQFGLVQPSARVCSAHADSFLFRRRVGSRRAKRFGGGRNRLCNQALFCGFERNRQTSYRTSRKFDSENSDKCCCYRKARRSIFETTRFSVSANLTIY